LFVTFFAEPLPTSDREIQILTHRIVRRVYIIPLCYEMDWAAMIGILGFINASGNYKLVRGTHSASSEQEDGIRLTN
jgi:hypothetical protein